MKNNLTAKNSNTLLKAWTKKKDGDIFLFHIDYKDREIDIVSTVFDKNKIVSFNGGMYKPIGYIPSKYKQDAFFILSSIMDSRLQKFLSNDRDELYETCKKNGCKLTDLFLCVSHYDNSMIGKVVLPSSRGLYSVNKNFRYIVL